MQHLSCWTFLENRGAWIERVSHTHSQSGVEATHAVTAKGVNRAGGRAALSGYLINSIPFTYSRPPPTLSAKHRTLSLSFSHRGRKYPWIKESGYYSNINAPLMGRLRRKQVWNWSRKECFHPQQWEFVPPAHTHTNTHFLNESILWLESARNSNKDMK